MERRSGIVEISDYVRECLREDEKFILQRALTSAAGLSAVLLLTPSSTHPRPGSLKKIEHEYSLCRDFSNPMAFISPFMT
jgi:hypothetical protein